MAAPARARKLPSRLAAQFVVFTLLLAALAIVRLGRWSASPWIDRLMIVSSLCEIALGVDVLVWLRQGVPGNYSAGRSRMPP